MNQLTVTKTDANVNLQFEDTGSTRYNLYVFKTAGPGAFQVGSASSGKKDCALAGVTPIGGGLNQISGYSLDAGLTGSTNLLYFLVTADNGSPTEGPLGEDSALNAESATSYCAR